MSKEASEFYKDLRVSADTLRTENTRLKRFKIPEGWGNEFTYQADCVEEKSGAGALVSSRYKAVNNSIAIEKALMFVPDGYRLSEVLILPDYPIYLDGKFYDGSKTWYQMSNLKRLIDQDRGFEIL